MKGAQMSDPDPIIEKYGKYPELTEILYNKLGIAEINVNFIFNAVVRDEILLALIRAGLLTRQQIADTLEKADQETAEMCADIESELKDKHTAEVLQKMKARAKEIKDGIHERVIAASSRASQ
jgi:predicted nuclease with TOPRIM domain